MKQFLILISFVFLLVFNGFATHERAGEIVYTHIEGLTYEVTIITYSYAPSFADRCELTIKWGDGTESVLQRTNGPAISNCPHGGEIVDIDIKRNLYTGVHTYGGNGTFRLSVEDPNRNWGIVNIPYSVNVPFYIDTELIIQPLLGYNNSVQLLNPPLDYACIDRLFIHNPGAYDPDGDSISYRLTICKGANGQYIPGYSYPEASNSFTIDEITGDLVWDEPVLQGEYNVAFVVEEWRSGIRIGYVTRDLQILVDACDNDPPIIESISEACVVAGDNLSFLVSAHDPNGDQVSLSATGSPLLQMSSPAQFTPNPAIGDSIATAEFSWDTECSHVLKEPHILYIKAKDTFPNPPPPPAPPSISLSTYKNIKITVIAPATEIVEAIPIGTSVALKWNKTNCTNAIRYHIYRKNDTADYIPEYCETGVPLSTGYVKIADVNGISDTTFKDDNNGFGLIHGVRYCYIVTYSFPDGAESIASNQMCAILKKDLPIITNVSVEQTSFDQGEMYVAWSKPTELDTVLIPGPYQYRVYRKENSTGSDFIELTIYYNLDDTLFYDSQLNTQDFQYTYRIDLYHGEPSNPEIVGATVATPSIFLKTFGTDQAVELSWNDDIPWKNEEFVIYRLNEETIEYDSIGLSNVPFYADTGLINGEEYCYKIKTIGRYASPGIIQPIINWSQFTCDKPVDNVPPCSPELTVTVNCDELINELTWIYPDSCELEQMQFYIYYSLGSDSDFGLLDSTGFISPENTDDYFYNFSTYPPSVVGCFAVTALDSLWNESAFSNTECIDIDECGLIWFPNVFTPNGDQWNQYFQADSVNSIANFEILIFNRWGTVVYESNDPFFKWDGRDQNNNKECSTGVYFYEARITHFTLRGTIEKKYRGNVTLLK